MKYNKLKLVNSNKRLQKYKEFKLVYPNKKFEIQKI